MSEGEIKCQASEEEKVGTGGEGHTPQRDGAGVKGAMNEVIQRGKSGETGHPESI